MRFVRRVFACVTAFVVAAAPASAQVRAISPVRAGSVVPMTGLGAVSLPTLPAFSPLTTPSFSAAAGFVLPSVPLASGALAFAPIAVTGASAVAVPRATPASAVAVLRQAAASVALPGANGAAPSVETARSHGEAFWSAAAEKPEHDSVVPATSAEARPSGLKPAAARRRSAAGAALPAVAALGALNLPAWLAKAVPYAKGAGLLLGAWALSRAARWALDKVAAKRGWNKNTLAMWRVLSAVSVWGGAGALALSMSGISGSDLAATFGVGGTAMALAVSLAVKDVAGNLFHAVHFLLTRPFAVGDKVTFGETTAIVRDLTLRYVVFVGDDGRDVLRTYTSLATAPVTLYGTYQTRELRLQFRKPALPRGLWSALREAAAAPTIWKPVAAASVSIAALAFFPLLGGVVAAKSLTWIGVLLPYLKAGVVAFLTSSISRALTRAISRLGERYDWNPAVVIVARLGASVLAWLVGGSFLLNAAGVSWGWVATTLSAGTALVTIAVTDYVTAIISAFVVFRLDPFAIGDTNVSIGKHTGAVVDITWQNVVLKLDDERYVILPHSFVKDAEIKNPRRYGPSQK